MENVSYNFSQTIITAVIASLGAAAVNAKIYTQTITAIVFTISVAAGQTSQIIIGRYLRKKNYKDTENFALKNTFSFMIIGAIINVIIALLGPCIIQIFTTDPEITQLIRILLWMNVLYDPLRVGNEIIIASLNVTGEVRYPVILGILVTYIFTVPGALIFGGWLNLGIVFIWILFILDEGIRIILFIRRWKQGDWKKHDLVYKKDE
jgi:Na+-driven multidrug efflux pump